MIASSTEIVHALGLGEYLVGRSHECDYPPSVGNLPVCTSPKFNPDGTSYEIDQRVRAIVEQALSVYRVDADIVERLQPTHIITQSQCQVCAVSLRDVEEAACALISSRPQIVSLSPNSLADIWQDIRTTGRALGHEEKAQELIRNLEQRIKDIGDRSSRVGSKPRTAFIEWIDPLMAGGNWMPELIDLAGGLDVFGVCGKHSPPLGWQDLQDSNPEVIVVAPCGFDIARTLSEMRFLSGRERWSRLAAVKDGRVFVADGNQFFNRPGPRIVESLEILAETLHPGQFHFGHEGSGWIKFSGDKSSPARA